MNDEKVNFKKQFKKRIYRFILKLIFFADLLDKKDPVCKVIIYQLIDSATGILSNYIESQVASSKKDFALYFRHSLKCVNETKFWITLIRDTKKSSKKDADNLLNELREIGNIFASSLITIKKNEV